MHIESITPVRGLQIVVVVLDDSFDAVWPPSKRGGRFDEHDLLNRDGGLRVHFAGHAVAKRLIDRGTPPESVEASMVELAYTVRGVEVFRILGGPRPGDRMGLLLDTLMPCDVGDEIEWALESTVARSC